MRVRFEISGILVVLALVGCGGESQGEVGASTPASATPTSDTLPPESKLVGEWERVTTCEERVQALTQAGLQRFSAEHAAGEGWIPGVTDPSQLADPKDPCEGAVPLEHSHFFTADGAFGSKDADGSTVDDGSYELVDDTTVVITKEFGEVTFHFVADEDTLVLTPVIPDCVKDGCFAAQWAVGMSYPGLEWQRTS